MIYYYKIVNIRTTPWDSPEGMESRCGAGLPDPKIPEYLLIPAFQLHAFVL
jgi:hypothetical protein